MIRRTVVWCLAVCWAASASGEGSAAKPDPLPPGVPPTLTSVYHLTFYLEKGLPYRDFIQRAQGVAMAREPDDIVKAFQGLGLHAEYRKAEVEDLLELEKPFLARDQEGHWLLYEVRDGKLHRLGPDRDVEVVVAEENFLDSWTGDLIVVSQFSEAYLKNAPRIEFEETEHDFGNVWQGEKVEHVFVFKSVGSGTLEITNVRASCGCTAVLVGRAGEDGSHPSTGSAEEERRFAPGEAGNIKVILNTAGKRHRTESSVTVTTNDPLNLSVRLLVKATVHVAVEVVPGQIYLGRVSKSSDLSKDVRITATEDPGFEILSATSANRRVQIELQRLDPQRGEETRINYVLKVTLAIEGMDYGEQIKDVIYLRTTSEHRPLIEIQVDATVSGDLYLAPNMLLFTPFTANREITRYLILRNNGPRDVNILEIRSDIDTPEPNFEIQTLVPGKQYRIKVTLNVGDDPEPFEGEVIIRTDHPEQPEFRVKASSKPPILSGASRAE